MLANRGAFSKIILVMISLIFTVFFTEIILRYYYFGKLSIVNTNADRWKFYHYDEELGWSSIPYSEGYFSNPRQGLNAYIKHNESGIRVNDNPFESRGKSILVVGDSVTAGFEVDNNETYSAILEKLFFENGCNYRVYDAGVSGYGTDQSLWNLERLLSIVQPDYVIYMFTINDFVDNRRIKRANTEWGKPTFALSNGELVLMNSPSKKYEISYYAYVNYTDESYEITEGYINEPLRLTMQFIKDNFALFYPLKTIYTYLQVSQESRIEIKAVDEDFKILELILERMKRHEVKLFFTSYPSEDAKLYVNNFRRISDKLNITYLNIYPYFTEQSENYQWKKDAHWNKKGHLQAAVALYELLNPHLCNQ